VRFFGIILVALAFGWVLDVFSAIAEHIRKWRSKHGE